VKNELVRLVQEVLLEECGCTMEAPANETITTIEVEAEPDDTIMQNLHKIQEYSRLLSLMLEGNAELPEWAKEKVIIASDRISSVFHYLEYQIKKEQENV
jgi:hypothetical protein